MPKWEKMKYINLDGNLNNKEKNYYKKIETKTERKKKMTMTLITGSAILGLFIITLTSLDVSRFVKQWNKE